MSRSHHRSVDARAKARTRLVINADDFGLSPAVSRGILEAHAFGTVTSTSLMVGCPGWDAVTSQLRSAPALGVGLHFNLLVGAPLVTGTSVTDRRTGRFLPLPALVRRALSGRLDIDDVRAECEAQLAALAGVGVRVTHIDSHRHTHMLPTVRTAVARCAARLCVPLRRPVESHRWFPLDLPSQLHRALINLVWRATSRTAPATRAPDHFIGVSMQGADRLGRRLGLLLDRLPSGSVELMVHPGHVDDALAATDEYTHDRERELAALTAPAIRARLQRADVTLCRFDEV